MGKIWLGTDNEDKYKKIFINSLYSPQTNNNGYNSQLKRILVMFFTFQNINGGYYILSFQLCKFYA